jgi:hypothetical protein
MSDTRNAQMAMGLLQGLGYQPHQAAGIVGNLMQESHVNPTVRPGDHGTAHGIAQWRGQRWSNMLNYAAHNGGNPNSLATQIGFLDHELKTQYPTAYRALMGSHTPEEAAGLFGLHYERPRGAQTGIASNIDGYGNRVNTARAMLGMSPMAYSEAGGGGTGRAGASPVTGDPGMGAGAGDAYARRDRGDVESPGDLVLGGEGGGGGGGGGGDPGSPGSTGVSGGGAIVGAPDEAFAQDTSGISDIQQRLAQTKQLAAMGQGNAIGEISPVGKVFDASVLQNIGQAANMQPMRKMG